MDPGFPYGVALAKVGGRMVLRLAQADVLPFDLAAARATVGRYVDEVVKLADGLREETETERWRIEQKVYENVADPERDAGGAAGQGSGAVPQLRAAAERGGGAAPRAPSSTRRRGRRDCGRRAGRPAATRRLDAILIGTERALTAR